MPKLLKVAFVIFAILGATACRDEYQEARDQCAVDHEKTVDYIQCVNEVNARQQADEDDAAVINTVIISSSIATMSQ